MTQELWTKVDEYIDAMLVGEDTALAAARRASEEAGLPAIAVTPSQGKLLMLMAQMIGARRILEIGTLGGYSTIWLARGLAKGGKLVTLEYEAKHAEVAKKNIARAKLAKIVELRLGDARKTLPELVKQGGKPFDLVFIDANKESTAEYFASALKMCRKGSLVVVDNVIRDGAVIDAASEDASIQGIRKFNELVKKTRRVGATAIQTVGSKGYDGLAVLRVLE